MSIARIKKNDIVIANAGEYKGQTGRVLSGPCTRPHWR